MSPKAQGATVVAEPVRRRTGLATREGPRGTAAGTAAALAACADLLLERGAGAGLRPRGVFFELLGEAAAGGQRLPVGKALSSPSMLKGDRPSGTPVL